MTEPAAGDGLTLPRAFLGMGGVSLARHQLGLALAMDCGKIVCVAREIAPELIALQHAAEFAGADFHIVTGPRALVGMVTATDELLALADGLLAAPDIARSLLEPGHAVLVQPVETGVAAGFERLDINYASAGALRIPGRLVERLLELPHDCDPVSALTRIALQAGIAQKEVPASAREGARWRLIRNETEAHAAEAEWFALQLGERPVPTPMNLLSRLGLTTLGPSLLHAGKASRIVLLAALATLLIALGVGWLAYPVAGFLLAGFASVVAVSATALNRIERAAIALPPPSLPLDAVLGRAVDLTLLALLIWSIPDTRYLPLTERGFAPLLLLILLRLAPRVVDSRWSAWIEDRLILAALLALAAGSGFLHGATQLLTLLLALLALLFPGGRPRITRA